MNRKPGDWNCSSCQHLNFSRRDSCQRCGDLRPGGSRGDERADYGSSFSRGGGGGGYGYGSGGSYGGGSDVRPGDWYCSSGGCGAHNFASRSNCFKCGTLKDESGGGGAAYEPSGGRGSRGSFGFGSGYNSGSGARSGWKSGDWICNRAGCGEHNFASRMECFKCSAPRETGVER